MTRERLPNRRPQITSTVKYSDAFGNGPDLEVEISFGFNRDRILKEIFISPSKTDYMTPILNDICILISRLLQNGDSIESIAHGLGENRLMDQTAFHHASPSSIVGAIARQGVTIQRDVLDAN